MVRYERVTGCPTHHSKALTAVDSAEQMLPPPVSSHQPSGSGAAAWKPGGPPPPGYHAAPLSSAFAGAETTAIKAFQIRFIRFVFIFIFLFCFVLLGFFFFSL